MNGTLPKPIERHKKGWWFVLLPTLAVWLGWGVRGQIGFATGAMIPGALLGLALAVLLKEKQVSPGLLAGLTAVGFGFGADETTLQTAGYLMGSNPDHVVNLGLAYSGLALKGALWAMFGGVGLGLGLAAYLYRKRDIVIGMLLLIAAFYVGVWTINRPMLLYFSLDRPEIWAGLLLGGITLLTWLTLRGGTRIPLVLAACAALGGGVGYPIAVTLAAAGMHSSLVGYDWWKLAETTFGAFIGAGVGLGAYLVKDHLPSRQEPPQPPTLQAWQWWGSIIGGALLAAAATGMYRNLLPWIILGSMLWCAAYSWKQVAWQIGVTMTFFATAANVVTFWHREQRFGNAALFWVLAALATLLVSWKVAGWCAESDRAAARNAFLFLLWALYILSCLKTFINSAVVNASPQALAAAGGRWPYLLHAWGSGLLVQGGFTAAVLALTWMV